ncbi:NAD(P)H-hydrate dehydratase [Gammaproteobacteria bacterium]|jgi:NAD(P)H-hydrate epimerase|nr:NAD(P)H-hydrate dehydratase [Gammaproteobacteria bacterium]MDA8915912.1 NAD(P)H-hydrate dehydratase [Gammaproteobacteria bacterium]MDB0001794.1 NAD(P)H-hydrate dehydratase [Gammaproteobacteria bacterium]MDB4156363.1 NAD(P)H-hydrate dehydratase [Gammaproteobacteria bacterium]MDC1376921.1 NAD(P)H-hydrate dehydratase [Gammaproteobacteria bacterium]|tara:strand:- start:17854 stop:18711 length:858 start_codon:yes stop_codon:yes gene_type:complete
MSILQSFTFQELKNLLPNRAKDSHKGNFGKVLICAGSPGMGGAGILASEASLFCGSGLVTLVTDTSNVSSSLLRNPEVMITGVDMVEGVNIDLKIKDHNVILYGPGIANTAFAKTILDKILKSANNSKIILDAGALHIAASSKSLIKKSNKTILMTPHPGEAAILLNISIEEVQRDRLSAAKQIADTYGASIVILKGMGTVVFDSKNNKSFVSSCGGPELATGGTGDVLAGVLTALLAQSLDIRNASLIAVAVHSEAGLKFKEEIGEIGLNASSLIPIIRQLLNQ